MNKKIDILLVEDNPADVELTLHGFKVQNINEKIYVANDGAEALEVVFGKEINDSENIKITPRLILLDLKLPKVDGLEVLKKLKDNPATRSIPVVILTSSREVSDMTRSYQLGANSYICKPVDFQEFKKVVNKLYLYWLLTNELPF